MIARLRRLPATVWLLGAISLLNDAASDLIYPLVPLYLASVLMAGPRALGLIEGLADAISSLLKLVAGVITDRTGSAKRWVVAGYALAALSRPLLAFAGSWPVVLGLRVADRIGKGLRSAPRDALLAHSVADDERGLAFGLHRAMDNAGAVIGPLAAAGLLALGMPLEDIFIWALLPGLLVMALSLTLREPAMPVSAPQPRDWHLSTLPRPLRRYLLVLALFTLGNSSNMFLLLRANELGLSPLAVTLLWTLTSLTATLLGTPLSALSDRWPRARLITAGWLLYAVVYLGLGWYQGATLWPFFLVYGLFLAATEGAEKAYVADLASGERLGTAYGWYNLVLGFSLLPASLLFGTLWETLGSFAAFAFSAACAGAAAVLLRYWVK